MGRRGRLRAQMVATLVVGAVLAGCAGDDADEGNDAGSATEAVAGEADASTDDSAAAHGSAVAAPAVQVDAAQRSVIYTVTMTVEVEDVAAAVERAQQIATTSVGYVQSESTSGSGEPRSTLTLRISATSYADAVTRLGELGTVTQRDRSAQDVTEEMVDVESRIATQQKSLTRVRDLLDRAQSITDIVNLESELATREAELESLQARLQALSQLTELATVTVTFEEVGTTASDETTATGFLAGLRGGWDAFVATLGVMLLVAGALSPSVVAAAAVGLPIWWLLRRRRAVVEAAQVSAE